MTTLTIRIEEGLKDAAFNQAQKLGIPLTLVVKNALTHFVKTKTVIIGDPKNVVVDKGLQEKMDKIGELLSKKNK